MFRGRPRLLYFIDSWVNMLITLYRRLQRAALLLFQTQDVNSVVTHTVNVCPCVFVVGRSGGHT